MELAYNETMTFMLEKITQITIHYKSNETRKAKITTHTMSVKTIDGRRRVYSPWQRGVKRIPQNQKKT
jgi:hypothetical protein